jgi:hypothetical protein
MLVIKLVQSKELGSSYVIGYTNGVSTGREISNHRAYNSGDKRFTENCLASSI